MDTIFASSPPLTDSERDSRIKAKTKKRNSPRRRRKMEQQQQESTDQETGHDPITHSARLRNSSSMMIDNLTGNITQFPDSVILNIDTSSDTSSSIDDDAHEEEEEVDDDSHQG